MKKHQNLLIFESEMTMLLRIHLSPFRTTKQIRLYAAFGYRGRGRSKRLSPRSKGNQKKLKQIHNPTTEPSNDPVVASTSTTSAETAPLNVFERFFTPKWTLRPYRFRFPTTAYFQKEHGWALFYRLPLFFGLAILLSFDETRPFSFIQIRGPSMIPTMAPDGSQVWLSVPSLVWSPQKGDIVGFSHPNYPQFTSCKRVVGVAGDTVQRYGEYIDIYARHDPRYWGMSPVDPARYPWVDWTIDRTDDPRATLVVPENHVWLEADCPGFGIDSRQLGPIPISWIRGLVVGRLWPLGGDRSSRKRPHPIPLNQGTLEKYNVHSVK